MNACVGHGDIGAGVIPAPLCHFLGGKEDPPVLFHAPLKGCPGVQISDNCFSAGYGACAGMHGFHLAVFICIKGDEPDLFRVSPDPVNSKPVLADVEEHVSLHGIPAWHRRLMQDIGGVRRDSPQPKLILIITHSPCPLTLFIPIRMPFPVCIFRFGNLQHSTRDDFPGVKVAFGDGNSGRFVFDIQDAAPDTVVAVAPHAAGIPVILLRQGKLMLPGVQRISGRGRSLPQDKGVREDRAVLAEPSGVCDIHGRFPVFIRHKSADHCPGIFIGKLEYRVGQGRSLLVGFIYPHCQGRGPVDHGKRRQFCVCGFLCDVKLHRGRIQHIAHALRQVIPSVAYILHGMRFWLADHLFRDQLPVIFVLGIDAVASGCPAIHKRCPGRDLSFLKGFLRILDLRPAPVQF